MGEAFEHVRRLDSLASIELVLSPSTGSSDQQTMPNFTKLFKDKRFESIAIYAEDVPPSVVETMLGAIDSAYPKFFVMEYGGHPKTLLDLLDGTKMNKAFVNLRFLAILFNLPQRVVGALWSLP